jgi:hypothetical protein
MGQTITLQLPFTGGLDQKTSRFYLDPSARLATVIDGNFVKQGAIDKRSGIGFVATSQAGGQRISSWSKAGLAMVSGGQLYGYSAASGMRAIGNVPTPRVIRRPMQTVPNEFASVYTLSTSQNANICDVPMGTALIRVAVYQGTVSTSGNSQIFAVVWDANTNTILHQPTLLYSGSSVPGLNTGASVAQVMYMAIPHTVAIVVLDTGVGHAIGFNYNPSTNVFTSFGTIVGNIYTYTSNAAFDIVPFVGDTTNSGMVAIYGSSSAGNFTLNYIYLSPSFTTIASGTLITGGPVNGSGTNFCPDMYVSATYGDLVWFAYGEYTGTSPGSWLAGLQAFSGDGLFTYLAGAGGFTSVNSPGKWVPPVRTVAGSCFGGVIVPIGGVVNQINSCGGFYYIFSYAAGSITVTDQGSWPICMHPAARAFVAPDGLIYQPAELCIYSQSGLGAQATQSTQGTLFLLQHQINSALSSRLLPVATVAPRQKTVDAQPMTLIAQPTISVPLHSQPALGASRFALSIRTNGVDDAALVGSVDPLWSVDFYFDAANQALLYSSIELGQEQRIAAASPFIYDGSIAFEDSFFYYPEFCYVTASGGGSLTGTYTYAIVYSYVDSAGLLHRSVPCFTNQATLTAGAATVSLLTLSVTWRDWAANNSGFGTVYAEVYRTTSSPSVPVFYLLTRLVVSNLNVGGFPPVNIYLNYEDNESDANLDVNTILYTTGGVLDNPCPPCAALQCAHKNRLWIVDETLRVIWFTQAFSPGLAPTWNELMTIQLPDGGDITAIQELDDKLIVFKANGIWVIYGGDGLTITGTGSDITNPQRISSDVGALDWRSVVLMPTGLMFRAASGIYLLDRSLTVSFIGKAVVDILASYPNVVAATLVPATTQVRFECNNGSLSIAIIYDYLLQQWTTHTRNHVSALVVGASLSSTSAGSTYSLLTADGNVWQELSTYLDIDASSVSHFVPTSVSTAWVKIQGVQGYQRARRALLMAEELDDCGLTMGFAVNYDSTIVQTYTWPSSVLDTLPVFEVEQHVAGAYNKEMSLQITVSDVLGANAVTGQGARFVGLAVEMDRIGDRMRQIPAAGRA